MAGEVWKLKGGRRGLPVRYASLLAGPSKPPLRQFRVLGWRGNCQRSVKFPLFAKAPAGLNAPGPHSFAGTAFGETGFGQFRIELWRWSGRAGCFPNGVGRNGRFVVQSEIHLPLLVSRQDASADCVRKRPVTPSMRFTSSRLP